MESVGTPALWAGFIALVLALLALDLGVFHRKAHVVRFKEAAVWSCVWVTLALLFNLGLYFRFGERLALEFLTGYVLEKSLAVDNIFVIAVLFSSFAVPAAYQHRVLFWGIVGALAMRGAFILIGGALLARFHALLYVFGALLLFTGIKLLRQGDIEVHPERNPLYRLFARLVPSVPEYHGERFLIRRDGRWLATPLFLVLVAIEASDVVFAVDSVPAIFAVTTDPFVVFTSNIFAILGLRAMYFLLAGAADRFQHLKVGLSLVLIFVGAKMCLVDLIKIPISLSLAVIAALVGGSLLPTLVGALRRRAAAQRAVPPLP